MVENAIMENNHSNAFSSKKIKYDLTKILFYTLLNKKFKLDYDVDWSDAGKSITNPFTLVHQQLVKEEEVFNLI